MVIKFYKSPTCVGLVLARTLKSDDFARAKFINLLSDKECTVLNKYYTVYLKYLSDVKLLKKVD